MNRPIITVSSLRVAYPYPAYPCQKSMMDRTIKSLQRSQNCLIESPTGTGKTLALLCGALAWQASYEGEFLEKSPSHLQVDLKSSQSRLSSEFHDPYEDENSNDFTCKPRKLIKITYEEEMRENRMLEEQYYAEAAAQGKQKPRKPLIYYATRTHKQLFQVIRELKKTQYCNVRMSILGSRDHTCINEEVRRAVDRSEACKQLLDRSEGTCPYREHLRKYDRNPGSLRGYIEEFLNRANERAQTCDTSKTMVWDIEELVDVCRADRICPYFACTDILKRDAELIFCPYNYLLDPMVRNAMQISLHHCVVILDEAHNIEDTCREAASYSVSLKELIAAVGELRKCKNAVSAVIEKDVIVALSDFISVCDGVRNWIQKESKDELLISREYGVYTRIWSGADILVQLKQMNCDRSALDALRNGFAVLNSKEENPGQELKSSVPLGCLKTVEKLMYSLRFIYRSKGSQENAYVMDYRLCIKKENVYEQEHSQNVSFIDGAEHGIQTTVNFWCMNPAVAFTEVSSVTRSVILASGTLAPLETFESELGTSFQLKLEARHVLPQDRMWVGSISTGPSGYPLRATYKFTESFEFQDEMGNLLLQICREVPKGVLMFLPSYRLIDRLLARWNATGVYEKLCVYKGVFLEPKRGEDLNRTMQQFYSVVSHPEEKSEDCNGALFIAVYRGKISEGLDFSDDNARAVIAVGIPYPNLKDLVVEMKRDYNNDRLKRVTGLAKVRLFSGDHWYDAQAYRALNQALGRCLRHVRDWGALILVDERFSQNSTKHTSGLSKWIRGNLVHYTNFPLMLNSLSAFTRRLTECP